MYRNTPISQLIQQTIKEGTRTRFAGGYIATRQRRNDNLVFATLVQKLNKKPYRIIVTKKACKHSTERHNWQRKTSMLIAPSYTTMLVKNLFLAIVITQCPANDFASSFSHALTTALG